MLTLHLMLTDCLVRNRTVFSGKRTLWFSGLTKLEVSWMQGIITNNSDKMLLCKRGEVWLYMVNYQDSYQIIEK